MASLCCQELYTNYMQETMDQINGDLETQIVHL
jgi:hypothetical protein